MKQLSGWINRAEKELVLSLGSFGFGEWGLGDWSMCVCVYVCVFWGEGKGRERIPSLESYFSSPPPCSFSHDISFLSINFLLHTLIGARKKGNTILSSALSKGAPTEQPFPLLLPHTKPQIQHIDTLFRQSSFAQCTNLPFAQPHIAFQCSPLFPF